MFFRFCVFVYIYLVFPVAVLVLVVDSYSRGVSGVSQKAEQDYDKIGHYVEYPDNINPREITAVLYNLPNADTHHYPDHLRATIRLKYLLGPIGPDSSKFEPPLENLSGGNLREELEQARKRTNSPVPEFLSELIKKYEATYREVEPLYKKLEPLDAQLRDKGRQISLLQVPARFGDPLMGTPADKLVTENFHASMKQFDAEIRQIVAERNVYAVQIVQKQKKLYDWIVNLKNKYPNPYNDTSDIEIKGDLAPDKQGGVSVIKVVAKPKPAAHSEPLSVGGRIALPFIILLAWHLWNLSKGNSLKFLSGRLVMAAIVIPIFMLFISYALCIFVSPYIAFYFATLFYYPDWVLLLLGAMLILSLWSLWVDYQDLRRNPVPPTA